MQHVFSFELGKPSTLWSIHVKCVWNYFPVERKAAILKTHTVSRQSLKDSKSVYTVVPGKTHIRGLLSRLSIAQVIPSVVRMGGTRDLLRPSFLCQLQILQRQCPHAAVRRCITYSKISVTVQDGFKRKHKA